MEDMKKWIETRININDDWKCENDEIKKRFK